MKYLQSLKDDLLSKFDDQLTAENVHLFIVDGEMSATSGDINYVARFLFVDCRGNKPFSFLTYIRWWFKQRGMSVPDLSFDSEIINAETYDLEIDLSLTDKTITNTDGTSHVCANNKIWSDTFADWVDPTIAQAVDTLDDTP